MSKYRSSRFAHKKRKRFLIVTGLGFVILVSFVFALSALSGCDFMKIKNVNILGVQEIKENDLKEIVWKDLDTKYLWLFSKDNIFIYPRKKIIGDVLKDFPKIRSASVDLDFPDSVNLKIDERMPYALWCGDATSTDCYFVDEEGYIFGTADDYSNDKFFRYYKNLGADIFIRQSIFDLKKFEDLDSFVVFLTGLEISPYKMVYKDDRNCEIYFGEGTKIIFDSTMDMKDIINNFQSILNMDEFSDVENLKKLEYVDLRFGNKIFYK